MAAIGSISRSVTLAAVFVAAAFPAFAETPADTACGNRAEMIKNLSGGFDERVVAMGIASNGATLIELLTSPDGATWTLLYSLPSGVSCLFATGENWLQKPATTASFGPGA